MASAAVFAATVALLVVATPAHAGTFKVTSNVAWISCSNETELWELYNSKSNSTSGGSYTTSWAEFYGDVYDYDGTEGLQITKVLLPVPGLVDVVAHPG